MNNGQETLDEEDGLIIGMLLFGVIYMQELVIS